MVALRAISAVHTGRTISQKLPLGLIELNVLLGWEADCRLSAPLLRLQPARFLDTNSKLRVTLINLLRLHSGNIPRAIYID